MSVALSRKVAAAFNVGAPSPNQRKTILNAIQGVDNFSDLPDKIQQMIESLAQKVQ